MTVPIASNDPQLIWTDEGLPRSGRFDDVYFSAEDGLAESRAVFLQGCGLPEAWRGRACFTVAELGFGSGLNILALLDLWRRERPEGGRLQVFSVEGYPLDRTSAARALAHWPELSGISELLLARWPARTPGFHRIDLPELSATIDLAVMEVGEALATWSGPADAWFLDGFAPSTNPEMWRDEVLDLIAARSRPGARAATFTVAGAVRRGLAERGFEVSKQPGHGRKRERLEALLPGPGDSAPRSGTPIAIVGGGVAGAALARAFRALGAEPVLIEAEAPGAGASGNPAALVTPRIDAGGGPVAALFAQALQRAAALYHATEGAVLSQGVLQLEHLPRDAGRFDRIADQRIWETDAMARLTPEGAGARLGEAVTRGGLWMADALGIAPGMVLKAWLGGVETLRSKVDRIISCEAGWRLLGPDGAVILEARTVCLAAGWGAAGLRPELGLGPVRGQASWAEGAHSPVAVAWGGYAAPMPGGLLFGATHDRGDATAEHRTEDDQRNLESLARSLPGLAWGVDASALRGRASVRAVTPDRLPLCGEIAPGLLVLAGLGSRGFTTAPLLAEHLAAKALGVASPLPAPLAALVAPGR